VSDTGVSKSAVTLPWRDDPGGGDDRAVFRGHYQGVGVLATVGNFYLSDDTKLVGARDRELRQVVPSFGAGALEAGAENDRHDRKHGKSPHRAPAISGAVTIGRAIWKMVPEGELATPKEPSMASTIRRDR
jgi:hypothetical protein